MNKTIQNNNVMGTMLIPLWGRSKNSKRYPEILLDTTAMKLTDEIDFDFTTIDQSLGEYGSLTYVVRARSIDLAIKDYITRYPKASVVNIGSGLDTTFERIDNGQITWYNLDLPEAIEFRNTLIDTTPRCHNISKSVFDYSWFGDVESDNGIIFTAGGVFHFFTEEKIKELIIKMAQHFPDGELYFDINNKAATDLSNEMMRKSGNHNALMSFSIDDSSRLNHWSEHIKLKACIPYFKDIERRSEWGEEVVKNMNMADEYEMCKYIWLSFIS